MADHLITTLSYQLARGNLRFADHLAATVHNDPAIFTKKLGPQMKALILDPMATMAAEDPNASQHLRIFLVDGLDECRRESDHSEIIDLLSSSASPYFRFIIASRPEFTIRTSFGISDIRNNTQTLALDEHYLPDVDIRQFLEDKFQDIKTNHLLRHSLPPLWPTVDVMTRLCIIHQANSFMQPLLSGTLNPHDITQWNILPLFSKLGYHQGSQRHHLHFLILSTTKYFQLVDNITEVFNIFLTLLFRFLGRSTLILVSLHWIETGLGYSPGQAKLILCDMHSLLSLKCSNNRKFCIYHTSSQIP